MKNSTSMLLYVLTLFIALAGATVIGLSERFLASWEALGALSG